MCKIAFASMQKDLEDCLGLRTQDQGPGTLRNQMLEHRGMYQNYACIPFSQSWKQLVHQSLHAAELAGNTITKCAAKPPAANPAEQRFSQVQDMFLKLNAITLNHNMIGLHGSSHGCQSLACGATRFGL